MHTDTNVRCKICKSDITANKTTAVSILDGSDFEFYYCTQCDALSSQSYDTSGLYERSSNNTNFSLKEQSIFNWLKYQFLKFSLVRTLGDVREKSQVLDYGCGNGDIANICDEIGHKTYAFDLPVNRPDCLSESVEYFNMDNFGISNVEFDIIILRHVLEHVPDPVNLIEMLATKIKDDGKIIIEVPNYESVFRKLMGGKWTGYFAPYHEMVLSEKSLRLICKRLGLNCSIRPREPFIFGVYFMHLGVSRSVARFMSLLFYPLQICTSKLFFTSEAIECTIKK